MGRHLGERIDINRTTWFLTVVEKSKQPPFDAFRRAAGKFVKVFEATYRVEVFFFVESATFEGI